MELSAVISRIEQRLSALNLTERAASMQATGKPDAIRNMKRGAMPSMATVCQLADTLDVSVQWLATGSEAKAREETDQPPSLDREALKAVLRGAYPIMAVTMRNLSAEEFANQIVDAYDVAIDQLRKHKAR